MDSKKEQEIKNAIELVSYSIREAIELNSKKYKIKLSEHEKLQVALELYRSYLVEITMTKNNSNEHTPGGKLLSLIKGEKC